MRKIFIIILMISLLPLIAYAEKKLTQAEKEKYIAITEFNIKILSNALEIYANEHYSDYPMKEEFYAKSFYKYIVKATGKEQSNPAQFYRCPPDGKILYERSKTERAYRLSCDNPGKFGLKSFYFSSKDGFVKDDGQKKAETLNMTKAEVKSEEVTEEEKAEMLEIIKQLYNAYKNRDLDKVMQIEDEAISRSALEMEARGKYSAAEVYYSFKGTANDLFRAEGFGMEPLNTSSLIFKKIGNEYIAASPVPVISTKQVTIGSMKVRLRIATFTFEKEDGKFRIVKMQMY